MIAAVGRFVPEFPVTIVPGDLSDEDIDGPVVAVDVLNERLPCALDRAFLPSPSAMEAPTRRLEPATPEKSKCSIQTEAPPSRHPEIHSRPARARPAAAMEFGDREAATARRSPRAVPCPRASPAYFTDPTSSRDQGRQRTGSISSRRSSPSSEHYMSARRYATAARSDEATDGETNVFNDEDAETVATHKDLIETRVRRRSPTTGGDITFRGFKDGIVYLI